MKTDPIVIANNYILSGDDIGIDRPNDNVLIDGISGSGKSTSVLFPTVARSKLSNPVMPFAKPAEGYKMAKYLKSKRYITDILDISSPERSTGSFDFIQSIESFADITSTASTIVLSVLEKTNDDFWNRDSIKLCEALIAATLMINDSPSTIDFLKLFDLTVVRESGSGIRAEADEIFKQIEMQNPTAMAVRKYNAWHNLPIKTASCVRDTLSSALETIFPESIRSMMGSVSPIDFEKLGTEKRAVIIISSALEPWQEYYMNLFYKTCIKKLMRYAEQCPGNHLPRPVRLYFDDFSCSSRILDFEIDIAIMRSAHISVMALLQSQSQLEAVYTAEKAAIIRQNFPVQAYFPGGFDIKSCETVSKQMNIPLNEVLYADLGKVFVMQTGKEPGIYDRYLTLESEEYKEYCRIIHREENQPKGKDR